MYHILICDDEVDIVNALKIYLTDPNYQLLCAYDGQQAVDMVKQNEIHLVLMDIMMPVLDGVAAMVKIRENSNIPVILLTAKSEDNDKVLGLTVGADDYITKPFSIRELLARIKANIRRVNFATKASSETHEPSESQENLLKLGRFLLNYDKASIYKDGEELELTQREFELMKHLMSHVDKVFSRNELMEMVWNYEGFVGDLRGVDVTVRRLREKIEDTPAEPKFILTKRGLGYYFSVE